LRQLLGEQAREIGAGFDLHTGGDFLGKELEEEISHKPSPLRERVG
jgi:hypothetical protein